MERKPSHTLLPASLAVVVGCSVGFGVVMPFQSAEATPRKVHSQPVAPAVTAANNDLDGLRMQVQDSPQDAKIRFLYAKALLAAGTRAQAASEFLEATALEPTFYLAYHQLTLCKPSNEQLDEAIERLKNLRNERPKELMLRVALSEVLEQRGDYYNAARSLIDLHYQDGIPAAYQAKIEARIHFLLSQTKDSQTAATAKRADAGLEPLDVPMPDAPLRKNLAANKKEASESSSFGHTTLLP